MSDELAKAVASLPANRFAIFDGARIEGLPELLRKRGLPVVPLYLEAGDEDGIRAGPYLVPLEGENALAFAIMLSTQQSAAVFWSWPSRVDTLRRHLRGLNLVEVPDEHRVDPAEPAYETLLFRHWDPSVLAVALPVLTIEQRSRFLGPANGCAYFSPEHGQIAVPMRSADLPPAPHGMLRFSRDQVLAIAERPLQRSRRRIADYLRDVAPDETRRLDAPSMAAMVGRFEHEARQLGLVLETDVALWGMLQLTTGATLFEQPAIRRLFESVEPSVGAHDRLTALLEVFEQRLTGVV